MAKSTAFVVTVFPDSVIEMLFWKERDKKVMSLINQTKKVNFLLYFLPVVYVFTYIWISVEISKYAWFALRELYNFLHTCLLFCFLIFSNLLCCSSISVHWKYIKQIAKFVFRDSLEHKMGFLFCRAMLEDLLFGFIVIHVCIWLKLSRLFDYKHSSCNHGFRPS